MEELYINGQIIYLSERTIPRTLQVNDFREVKDRQGNYSNTVKIPRTPENIKSFEYLGVIGNTSTIAYREISVKYVLDGIEMATDGRGVIKATNEFYDFNFYDGNVSMSKLLGSLKLSDLDFSSYDHNLDYAAFFNSFTNTSGYVYGLRGLSMVDISLTSPSFYIYTLIDMIFTQKGWVIEGDIFTDLDYKSRLTTMNIGFDDTLTPSVSTKYTQANSAGHSDNYVIPTTTSYLVDSYTTLDEGVFNVGISGDITLVLGTVTLEVRVNGTPSGIIYDSGDNTIPDNLDTYAEVGDAITTYVVAVAEEFAVNDYRINFTENFTTTMELDESYFTIVFADIIGSTTQIDFVKDVMQRFNLSFRKVRNENKLQFIQSNVLLTDKAGAEDWSSMYSSKLNEITKSNYSIKNDFKYKYDNSGNDYADGSMILTDVNLTESKTLLTSLFKASEKINGVYSIPLWQLQDGVYSPVQDDLRIFKLVDNVIPKNFRLKYGQGNYFLKSGTFKDLDFSDLLYQSEIDNNYGEFTSLIDKFKLVKAEVNMSVIDVYNLDFFKLKYFEQTGKFYYLNKIMSFKNDINTKVELLEIPI